MKTFAAFASALWRRVDAPGHDAAQLVRTDTGWQLQGTAVFLLRNGPACLHYAVQLDGQWQTCSGTVRGFIGDRAIAHTIDRSPADDWVHNGRLVPGLDPLVDLDFAFTPATNLQQLKRMALGTGQAADLPVAWLDAEADAGTLVALPQRYRRLNATRYAYDAPTVSYQAVLEVHDSGFIADYPGLWTLVCAAGCAGAQG